MATCTSRHRVVLLLGRQPGLAVLRSLVASPEYSVVAVFAHKRLPKVEDEARGERPEWAELSQRCKDEGIALFAVDGKAQAARQAVALSGEKDPSVEVEVERIHFDFMVSCSWRRMVPLQLLRSPAMYRDDLDTGVINLHRGALPAYVGAEPVRRALDNGDSHVEITAHIMVEELDAGRPLAIYRTFVPESPFPKEEILQATEIVKNRLVPHYGPLALRALNEYRAIRTSAIAFDCDGVLVDTLPALRRAFAAFMGAHGLADQASFDYFDAELNGPTISECVEILCAKYGITGEHDALLQQYMSFVHQETVQAPFMPGAIDALAEAQRRGYRVAIVSSGSTEYLAGITARLPPDVAANLVVVSATTVAQGKPAPDCYNLARKQLDLSDADTLVAVEDSLAGLQAAQAAGPSVVLHYAADAARSVDLSSMPLSSVIPLASFTSFPLVLSALADRQRWRPAAQIEVSLVDVGLSALSSEQAALVDQTWTTQGVPSGKHDGTLLSVASIDFREQTCKLTLTPVPFRRFYAQLTTGEDLGVLPLGVSAVVRSADNQKALLGFRGDGVSQFKRFGEFAGSGSVEVDAATGAIDLAANLRRELAEETSLSPDSLLDPRALGIVLDPQSRVVDAVYQFRADGDGQVEARGDEYSQILWTSLHDTRSTLGHLLCPTSLAIYAGLL